MRAVRFHEFGEADRLVLEEVPEPQPGRGQVRVRVSAIGINFIDTYHRKGLYPNPLPMIPGGEFAGKVDAVGEGVTEFQIGDRVATASGTGGYAEYALVDASRLAHIPEGVSDEQAAAVLLQGITAHYLALSTYPLKPGDTAVIHAAAGGVGQLLVQIAKRQGARVLATVSTDEKARIARAAGADEVILYSQVDFEPEVKRLTNGLGVEVVYDGVGRATFDRSINCLKPRGMMILYGQSSGPVPPLDPQLLNRKGSLFLTRPSMGAYLLTQDEFAWRTGDLFNWLKSGELKVRIDQTFPLAEAPAAHQYIEGRNTKGKVLLII